MNRTVAVFGPTAVGKTTVATALAQCIGGEIVNADAVQIYRGLDRGSAKPDLAERAAVAHHLLDIADPEMDVSVAAYQELAVAALREIRRRGRVPIVSGGSGLYLRAALGEWDSFGAPPDLALRAWAARASTQEIQRRALEADPEGAAALSPMDRPRLIRVIERARGPGGGRGGVRLQTGNLVLKVGLYRPRRELYARIDERTGQIWPALLAEAETLLRRLSPERVEGLRAVGYKEASLVLRGALAEQDALRAVAQRTRNLAKRQMTWWRRERDVIWLRPDEALWQLGPTLCAMGLLPASR